LFIVKKKVSPRAGVNIWKTDKFLAILGIRTLDCPACSLVTVLIMLYHFHSVLNKIKFGQ